MKEKLRRLLEAFDIKKFIKFGLVGVLNTVVDFAIFQLVYRLLCAAGGLPPDGLDNPTWITAAAQAVAFAAATLHSFVWNKLWTFEKRSKVTKKEAGRYIATQVGYYVISLLLVRGVAALFHVPDTVAKLPATCCMIPYNYLMNKFWVFR